MAVSPYFRRSRRPKRRKLLRRMAQRYRSGQPCLTTEVVTTSVTWHSRTNSAACWMNKRLKSSLHLSLPTLRIGSRPVHLLPCLSASPGHACDQCSGSIQLIRTAQAPANPACRPVVVAKSPRWAEKEPPGRARPSKPPSSERFPIPVPVQNTTNNECE